MVTNLSPREAIRLEGSGTRALTPPAHLHHLAVQVAPDPHAERFTSPLFPFFSKKKELANYIIGPLVSAFLKPLSHLFPSNFLARNLLVTHVAVCNRRKPSDHLASQVGPPVSLGQAT